MTPQQDIELRSFSELVKSLDGMSRAEREVAEYYLNAVGSLPPNPSRCQRWNGSEWVSTPPKLWGGFAWLLNIPASAYRDGHWTSTPPVPVPSFTAEGGDTYQIGNYTYHAFSTAGDHDLICTGSRYGDVLVVAGGGSGWLGAGGAGGVEVFPNITLGGGDILGSVDMVASVGDGGAPGNNGENSIFGAIPEVFAGYETVGGGKGAAGRDTNGSDGGSGGGAGPNYYQPNGTAHGGSGIAGQGHAGSFNYNEYGGAGGGAGTSATYDLVGNDYRGIPGDGIEWPTGSGNYYGGGGSPSHYSDGDPFPGGLGGGGTGGRYPYATWSEPQIQGGPGTDGLGGGGGGSSVFDTIVGTKGGCGCIIVRYLTIV